MFVYSVRLNERKQRGVDDNKKMAYLIDLKTIAICKYLMYWFLKNLHNLQMSHLDWVYHYWNLINLDPGCLQVSS